MMTETSSRTYLTIWGWLMGLALLGIALTSFPIPKTVAMALVLIVAAVKAALVARNYMHLKAEHALISIILVVPILLFLGMALVLVPDIVFRR